MAVSRAVESGRLQRSVIRDAKGQPKIADPDLADREWDAHTDLSRAPGYVRERADARKAAETARPPPPIPDPLSVDLAAPSAHEGMTLAEASAVEKIWRAKTAELKFKEAAGELVPAADVSAKLVNVFTQCKTKLLGLPSRARQALPHLTVADIGVLEQLVREALEDLASAGDEA